MPICRTHLCVLYLHAETSRLGRDSVSKQCRRSAFFLLNANSDTLFLIKLRSSTISSTILNNYDLEHVNTHLKMPISREPYTLTNVKLDKMADTGTKPCVRKMKIT